MIANGRRVLTADDSKAMRQMIALTLNSVGIAVAEAEDGAIALDMAQKETFGLVLVDLNMPNLDGLSLVRELRGMPEYRFTPLIILTTDTSLKKREKGQAIGVTGWLQKPFQPDQLIVTVRRALG